MEASLVGQASTPAAGLQTRQWHCSHKEGGSWRTRADLEVCPTAMFNGFAGLVDDQMTGSGTR
jgi:hypothetical protein